MKHLKQYEHIEPQLKKYVIWNNNPIGEDSYEIIEIIRATNIDDINMLYFSKILYYFNTKVGKIKSVNSNSSENFSSESIKKHIVLTSNNIEECIDYLKLMSSANKYNL